MRKTPSGLGIQDVAVGQGEEARPGQRVSVHYRGTLLSDGSEFDSSLKRHEPFSFNLGAGEVIQGWDEGVAGMRIGGKRVLYVPAGLAYGKRGAPPDIPPNAALRFEVQLLGTQ
ncbi:MAG: FKBP-type peptidyl-prolyl cis-trans isomerase [Cyanobacteria bacterium HKST-UBA05]|nr:FKBP-type peptidyl-prolyl cis-trans isomerase [Cyanobacteria bacterium HKST-UBA05]